MLLAMDRKHEPPTVLTVSSVRVVTENDGESALVQIARFDELPATRAADLLHPCCGSRRWVGEMVSGRPYGSMRRVIGASDDIVADLHWSDIAEALAGHPRIGARVGGADRGSAWSRQEQSGAADSSVRDELVRGNMAYETRFGHVFLICASGRSATEMLTALRERLANPTAVEREVVRDELRRIVRLRLIKTFR